ncbi:GntR family transcriptional regulator [Streptomyces coeruleorubidus]|uniref:GntR family transcriptional regulator n=1 Tax=Streptomyces coeruleorubidus TaxID=116188 RepID=UPI00237F59AC|nr:GntR family transcriptional regulator [Streptomyces coeruleorubidus]WDV55981.1 GntR family transcriptional regulator [Streptomyces coeruleorubidus]
MPTHARPSTGEKAEQHALAQLRQAIAQGETAPAQRLVENELAEQFGVTRAGIRAALIDPEARGLVERIRNRGSPVRVRVVTVEEAVAITEYRMVLEGLCAAEAAVAASDERLAEPTALGRPMTKAVADARGGRAAPSPWPSPAHLGALVRADLGRRLPQQRPAMIRATVSIGLAAVRSSRRVGAPRRPLSGGADRGVRLGLYALVGCKGGATGG